MTPIKTELVSVEVTTALQVFIGEMRRCDKAFWRKWKQILAARLGERRRDQRDNDDNNNDDENNKDNNKDDDDDNNNNNKNNNNNNQKQQKIVLYLTE